MIVTGYVYNDFGAVVPNLKVYIKENPNTFSFTDENGKVAISVEVGQTIIFMNEQTGQVVAFPFTQKQDAIKIKFPLEVISLPIEDLPVQEVLKPVCKKVDVHWVFAGLAFFGTIKLLTGSSAKKVTI